MKLTNKKMFIALALCAAPAFAEDGPSVGHVTIGSPVYATHNATQETVDTAQVLFANMAEIQKQLADNALEGKVKLGGVYITGGPDLGRNHRTYSFSLEQCPWRQPCYSTGSLEIHQHRFLARDGEVLSYDVQLNLPPNN